MFRLILAFFISIFMTSTAMAETVVIGKQSFPGEMYVPALTKALGKTGLLNLQSASKKYYKTLKAASKNKLFPGEMYDPIASNWSAQIKKAMARLNKVGGEGVQMKEALQRIYYQVAKLGLLRKRPGRIPPIDELFASVPEASFSKGLVFIK